VTPTELYEAVHAERYGQRAPTTAAEVTHLGGGPPVDDQVLKLARLRWSVGQIAALLQVDAVQVERILAGHRQPAGEQPCD
jgi:hypothetical protein